MNDNGIFSVQARILPMPEPAARDALMVKLQSRVSKAFLEGREAYFWSARASSDERDTYYTTMDPGSTLQNFARDAQDGVSFLIGHKTDNFGVGKSLDGRVVQADDAKNKRETQENPNSTVPTVFFDADFYTFRGMTLGPMSVDNFIDGVDGGILDKVSVGFYSGRYICNICTKDALKDWSCWHCPGIEYEQQDKNGKSLGNKTCEFNIVDARLYEVSSVPRGANPSATILKAQRCLEAGKLTDRDADLLLMRYRGMGLEPVLTRRSIIVPAMPTEQPKSTEEPKPMDPIDSIRSLVTARGFEGEPVAAVTAALGELDQRRDLMPKLEGQVTTLTQERDEANKKLEEEARWGKVGREYHETVLEGALRSATASGRFSTEPTKRDGYEKMLRKLDTDDVLVLWEQTDEEAAKRFPGGRITREVVTGGKKQSDDSGENNGGNSDPDARKLNPAVHRV